MAVRHIHGFILRHILRTYAPPPDEPREDGYDARLVWKPQTERDALQLFRHAVLRRSRDGVAKLLTRILGEEEDYKNQLEELCDLVLADFDRPFQREVSLKEALLTSVVIGSRPLVECVLQLFDDHPGSEFAPHPSSMAFPPHMTPLTLACVCNNYGIVECLLLRGHHLELPHRADCKCAECHDVEQFDAVSLQRLDRYRAVCSEAFLWMGTSDPVLAACSVAKDLEICEHNDQEHREIYRRLAKDVRKFSVHVMQQCWSTEEVECMLRQQDGVSLSEAQLPYPRVRKALNCRMKEFLAHMNVQLAMRKNWYGQWTDYGRNGLKDTWRMLMQVFLFPVLSLLHAISGGFLIKSMTFPKARFVSYCSSYLLFLIVIGLLRFGNTAHDSIYSPFAMVLQLYVFLYVLGQIIAEFMEFARRGAVRYFELWWRWFDFILLLVFVISFMCFLAALPGSKHRILHRRHWAWYDPMILYEIFFGTACMMSFWRSFYFIQLERNFGSTVISTGRCIRTVLEYFCIMAIVMFAFSIAINTILQPYSNSKELDDEGNPQTTTASFSSMIFSMKNLFWAFYGYLSPSDYKTAVGNVGPTQEPANHALTLAAAEVLIAIYYVVMIITLLNLMMSLLVERAHEVLENEDVEWKYTRVHIYSEYWDESAALPPPFNILHIVTSFVRRLFSRQWAFHGIDLLIPRSLVDEHCEQRRDLRSRYETLLVKLFQRYVSTRRYHYRTLMQIDGEKEQKESFPKVAYLNQHSMPPTRSAVNLQQTSIGDITAAPA